MTNQNTRSSFAFYRAFYDAIKTLPKENQLEVYNAICRHSLNEEVLPLKGISNSVFTLIKTKLDMDLERYYNGKKRVDSQTFLYFIELKNELENFVKIGIAKDVNKRISAFKRCGYDVFILKNIRFDCLKDALDAELKMHNKYKTYQYYPLKKIGGYSECFTHNISKLIHTKND